MVHYFFLIHFTVRRSRDLQPAGHLRITGVTIKSHNPKLLYISIASVKTFSQVGLHLPGPHWQQSDHALCATRLAVARLPLTTFEKGRPVALSTAVHQGNREKRREKHGTNTKSFGSIDDMLGGGLSFGSYQNGVCFS